MALAWKVEGDLIFYHFPLLLLPICYEETHESNSLVDFYFIFFLSKKVKIKGDKFWSGIINFRKWEEPFQQVMFCMDTAQNFWTFHCSILIGIAGDGDFPP